MPRDSARDAATLRTVHAAALAGEHGRAAALAEAAIADGLEHPLLYNLAALGLEQSGRVADAAGLLRRAVLFAPTDPGVRNALGLCLLRLDRPAEALEQFETLLRLDPSLPFAHASHGAAQLALGKLTAAETSYRGALALDPEQGVALAGLAHIASRRGDYREARRFAEAALGRVPNLPDVAMSLAAADLGEGIPARAERRLGELLANPQLEPLDRADALGLLGDVLDAENRTGEAYAAYAACNSALRQIHAERYGSGQNALEYVRSLTRYFDAAQPAEWRWRRPPDPEPAGRRQHVFLLGFPRSGTTLLEVILEGHPDVVGLEEHELLIHGLNAYMRSAADLGQLARAAPAALEPLRTAYWQLVAEAGIAVAGKLFLDKYPLNLLKLPLIARLFPDAKILIACRDPRDVVLSCFRRRFRMSAPMYELLTLDGAASYYDAVMRLTLRMTSTLGLEPCLVRHEDLVTEFTREMKRVCEFLGLEWVPAMGDFALRTSTRAAATPSTAQLVRGLNTEGLGQWLRYRAQLAPVLPRLAPWVEHFGYGS